MAKPKIGITDGLKQLAEDITEKIRAASKAHIRRMVVPTVTTVPQTTSALGSAAEALHAQTSRPGASRTVAAPPERPSPTPIGRLSTEKIIFIGASTGGTEATKDVLINLPADCPAVMITQHMPAGFTKSYAARLDSLCRIRVAEARDGERVLPGHAYLAPGGFHLSVERSGANYIARVTEGEPVNRHKPSVEVLFNSAARVVGPNALGVMLTGMGADGAKAMLAMRDAGSFNIAQDEESCVVFGMPKEAIAQGAAHEVLSLNRIAARLIERLRSAGGIGNRV